MKNVLNVIWEKIKLVYKNILTYIVILSTACASFFIGVVYQKMNNKPKKYEITKVSRQDIVLAVDENNNLILIKKSTGDYTIYQDSIGECIFKMYANSVWSQNVKKTEIIK